MKHLHGAIFLLSIVVAVSAAAAESTPSLEHFLSGGFPDNADLRSRLFSSVIGAPRELAIAYGERILQGATGKVLVRTVQRPEDFFVEFLNGSGGNFTEASQGSVVIERSNSKGFLMQAKIYLQDDPSCYLRLYTGGEGTRVDVIMYGAVLKRGLSVPEMLYVVLARPFSEIVDATRRSFDWETVFELGSRSAAADLAAELRSLPQGAASAAQPRDLPRSARLAAQIDAATSVNGLLGDLAAAGETGARELTSPAIPPLGFADDQGDLAVRLPYADFPRYESGKGLPLSALRASLYLDILESPDSAYLVLGEGLRALVVPSFEGGRLHFAVFSGGKEVAWSDLADNHGGLKVRIVRIPAKG